MRRAACPLPNHLLTTSQPPNHLPSTSPPPQVAGGWLWQDADSLQPEAITFTCVSEAQPTQQQLEDLKFAWRWVRGGGGGVCICVCVGGGGGVY